ncbi:endolysin [Candidatus Williamhamiltonella defendens]|uniref:Endolysin n=1 Tax=Candidatus Williamhamiltonella defendens TaxID=138072 RepID=A0A2D3T300_9ENTR|nr:M15 family metallopeptidase [Candidatus Hamiltonella defensa]ASV34134.1 endolysin [Candidatus Hamiltonella defensa]ATW30063.1 endolysin [Candidatus Hamiltonella defensa]ATW32070.1 endolysin [Candidatus Hamiltonella defensa]MBK4361683.1 M15 family peptidase [Candidatus Hamiltonella defensa]
MAYKLGPRSRQRLEGVHPDLVCVVERAIQITPVDFTVLEGVRTVERQKTLLAKGASKTMNSRHLTGHAVDLGACLDGSVRWDWPLYYPIADAMKQAAEELGIRVYWGACWSCINDEDNVSDAVIAYIERKKAVGKKPFMDGPHFQLPWSDFPDNACLEEAS